MEDMSSILRQWLDETVPYIRLDKTSLRGLWTTISLPVLAIGVGLLYYLH